MPRSSARSPASRTPRCGSSAGCCRSRRSARRCRRCSPSSAATPSTTSRSTKRRSTTCSSTSPARRCAMRDSPLYQLTVTRLREFFREPGAVFWVFGFPVLLAVGLGIAFRNRPPEKPRVAVEAGAEWVAAPLSKSELLVVETLEEAAAADALRRARVDLHVRAEERSVVYRYDPIRPESRLARAMVDDVLQRAL